MKGHVTDDDNRHTIISQSKGRASTRANVDQVPSSLGGLRQLMIYIDAWRRAVFGSCRENSYVIEHTIDSVKPRAGRRGRDLS